MICLRAGGEQPRLAVIFRGGRRFGADEKQLWNPQVDVYFQEKASLDTAIACEWVKHTLGKNLERGGSRRFVLFCGNSAALRSGEFHGQISSKGGVVWHGLDDAEEVATALWQPIEAGPAQLLKVLVGQAQRSWLESKENAALWHGETKGFTAKDRRVLITHWAAQAWSKFITEEYSQFNLTAWQKTGCLITADGSDDHLIKPEDIGADYVVTPPAPFEPYLQAPILQRFEQHPDESSSDDILVGGGAETLESSQRLLLSMGSSMPSLANGFNLPPMEPNAGVVVASAVNDAAAVAGWNHDAAEADSPLRDDPADRDFNHELVGRQLKVWYEDGWATGRISYYNIKFAMMKVDFNEDADFVAPHDIDGIEVVLL